MADGFPRVLLFPSWCSPWKGRGKYSRTAPPSTSHQGGWCNFWERNEQYQGPSYLVIWPRVGDKASPFHPVWGHVQSGCTAWPCPVDLLWKARRPSPPRSHNSWLFLEQRFFCMLLPWGCLPINWKLKTLLLQDHMLTVWRILWGEVPSHLK